MDDLARIVQEGFLNMNERFDIVETDLGEIKTDVSEMKTSIEHLEADLNKKVDKIDHNTLTYRVEKLEKLSKKFA